ncbi:MAG: cytochrome c [Candidatus Latescibacteria bacterium]|jgi:mono/diheme cytochrome c family protein|nr:cytochrome c [Candidatus Latescibacterota bacterium]
MRYLKLKSNQYQLTSLGLLCLICVTTLAACRQDMHDQPKYEPYEVSSFFDDKRTARNPVEGTIARGNLRADDHLYTGKVNGELATTFPFEVTREVLERGQERFGIYCAPCHSSIGDGNGMIAQRGGSSMKQPATYHSQQMRDMPVGHFFDVMTNGFGSMYSYSERISVRDRWAIAAYIRVLQMSQNASIEDVPAAQRQRLIMGEQ